MSSTTPFAGTSVPAEGVSLWLARFLQSTTVEDSLALLLELLGDWSPQPVALWLWPEPSFQAIGLIGTARFYEWASRELPHSSPRNRDLAEWSFPESPADAICIHPVTAGAICWSSRDHLELTEEQLLWVGTLLDWIAMRESRLRDAKLKSLAEFAAGAGHEINNPLGTILGRSQLLQRQETDPERRRWLSAIGGQALRIRDMISDTMVFARPPSPKPQSVDMEPLFRAVADRFEEELTREQIVLAIHREPACSPEQTAWLDPEQFQVVCIELLRNAIQAVTAPGVPEPRRIRASIRRRTWNEAEWFELDLYNNGPELTAEERMHAFDPFFSGRNAGRGLGFGLTKCWRIITGHGGQIGVHSTARFTVFRSLWPVCPPNISATDGTPE